MFLPIKSRSQLMATCLYCKETNTIKYTNYSKYYKDEHKKKK